MKLSIIVPCYNEEKNIPELLESFSKAIRRTDIELIIVQNGSTDRSAEILDQSLSKYSFLRIVNVPINQGYGYGILAGLKEAKGEYLGWMHGDLQTPSTDAVTALELIEKYGEPKNIYVKGSRHGRALADLVFTFGMAIFESLYLHKFLFDINAQPNIFHRSFLETWKNPPYDFSLDLYAYYQAKIQKLNIVRFPVFFPKRLHGHSHWNTGWLAKWKLIKRTLDFSRSLKQSNLAKNS
jgi:glycosyltransferase involved in cell wall biosynthesis